MNSAERLQKPARRARGGADQAARGATRGQRRGEIVFKDIEMPQGPAAGAQGLNLHVAAGERVGVVGRTGAGKSSIMTTLFRMVELSGGKHHHRRGRHRRRRRARGPAHAHEHHPAGPDPVQGARCVATSTRSGSAPT